ncbi:MAG TPA: glycosyltransferase family 9 protein [bacterium]|nr:glycosyltransferase family 9 protein [bacterium]
MNALALVNGLRKGYPDAEITWITQVIPRELIGNHPSVSRFITYDRRMTLPQWRGFLKSLRSESYDLLLVPQVSAKASLISLAVRAPVKIGFNIARTRELNWLVTNRKIPARPAAHVLDQYMEFLDYLEIPMERPVWNITFTTAEQEWRDRWAARFDRPLVAFVPASSRPEKDWLPEHYATVIDRVETELECQPVIIGGPGRRESELTRRICSLTRCDPDVALEKPIRRTLLQISSVRTLVAPDTGPLHMAVALNIPTVGLYGYSNPDRCGPYYYRDLLVDAYHEPGAQRRPIRRKTKPGRMNTITPDQVFDRIRLALEQYEPGCQPRK